MKKQDLKDMLEMLEAISTILLFIMTVWGSIHLWESGFMDKIHDVVDYMHKETKVFEKKEEYLNSSFFIITLKILT